MLLEANVIVNKMNKLSFRAWPLEASKPMPIYLSEELPGLPEYSEINRAVPQMPSGMKKEEECVSKIIVDCNSTLFYRLGRLDS